ncbi:hypothetical protein F7734_29860 [Scytonema sp. UIC 10036]|uniref:hypothetical protein n=1 Tax=Scytonema sp. UIC 10036 TaxID=2304196 RepID=UPI0012DA7282|nr:hypothetical protein [Scytonema sp. UIC 10036]MUG96319.1 hypothetical protein [Scytonema sp. UIC 10036]
MGIGWVSPNIYRHWLGFSQHLSALVGFLPTFIGIGWVERQRNPTYNSLNRAVLPSVPSDLCQWGIKPHCLHGVYNRLGSESPTEVSLLPSASSKAAFFNIYVLGIYVGSHIR